MQTRRSFLRASALALAAHAAFGTRAAGAAEKQATGPLVGSQLYGWGQFYEREHKNLAQHMDEALSALRDAGYDYAETSLDTGRPEQNAKFAESLKAKGMRPVALYSGGRLHEKEAAEKAIAGIVRAGSVAAQAGFSIINCNPDPIGRVKTPEELNIQAAALNTLGAELRKVGLRLGVHNHTPEMQNNAAEFRHNLTATRAEDVGFCYDVHWVYRGGIPPGKALPEFGRRVVSWHLRQSRNGVWLEDLEEGDIDYGWVAQYVREHHLPQIYSVEIALERGTKVTRSAAENHRRSREFVRKVFGV